LRYQGTDTALPVPLGGVAEMTAGFEQAYRQQFSFLMPDKQVLVEALSVEASAAPEPPAPAGVGPGGRPPQTPPPGVGPGGRPPQTHPPSVGPGGRPPQTPPPGQRPGGRGEDGGRGASAGDRAGTATVPMYLSGSWRDVPLARRQDLAPGWRADGPALIVEDFATTVVEQGWRAEVTGRGDLLLRRQEPPPGRRVAGTGADPVLLEIFNNLFMSVAEQMGVRLRATAHSVNIKERLDFSCAVFDAAGGLIANAPHMPVHLGSMGESIRIVAERNAGRMRPGDVYALNDPYHGGTHLPDVTVVTPVFGDDGEGILFYVAARGHHAEIGGITPGSMPAGSTRVEEEGVLIDNWLLVRGGTLREEQTLDLLRDAPYPSRNPEVNLADLRAQIAACERGVQELRRMCEHFGLDVVRAYMGHVQDNAEEAVRRLIGRLRDGEYRYETDGGAVIAVSARVDRAARTAVIDFTGTSPQQPGNFNAPSSVAMAAVLYVLRTLVGDEIPLNSGCLKPVTVIIPPGCLLAPEYPAAVAAGNVETSQAVTGALYAALGVMAEGSGTMNNVTVGNDRHQYYETVASGSGAGDGFGGTDAVQTHMTNSRLTDPEVLEWRYPVRVQRHQIRRGSGGAGRWRGGDGCRRELWFGEPMTVTTLASHRRVPPYGMAGGAPGALGRHWIERADGTVTPLAGCDSVPVKAGDVFVIETPGGGGYGPPE
ncbi:MAG: hydantoinase B/oxoprolinase family protein, partial [Actinobacteria bacterium]|nr:hydantoinase B/oxoprolinase family protein [Actinomycetota bacterium]